jgi:peptidyl-prolyl cis-trans isomerase D
MSVIQQIREKYAGIVIAFIAVSLIAFILMDAFSGRNGGGGWFGNHSTVGKVNGTKIDKKDFDKQVEIFKKAYGQDNAPYDQVANQVWNVSVDNIIMQDEYEKTGIVFSNKELNSVLSSTTNPPLWLKQNFTDQATGEYNYQQAMDYLKQIRQMKNDPRATEFYEIYIQQQTIEQTLRTKFMSLLNNSSYAPKWLAQKQLADNNAISSISYVYVPYSSITDSSITVTDDDVKAYVKKHEKLFTVDEETRTVNYVTFDANPGPQDTLTAVNQVQQYRNEFATTKDEKSFLERVGTDMPFYNSYMGATRIQHSYKDSIIKAGIGNVYGPYIDGKEVVLAKLIGVKNWPDSAKVRHILVQTFNPQTGQRLKDDSAAKKLIDSIQLAVRNGVSFDSLAKKFSDDGSKDKGGILISQNGSEYFAQGDMVEEFNDFAFDKKVGEKGVVKTIFGYHYIEVLGQKNFQQAYKIAYLAKEVAASSETVDAAMAEAQRFAASSRNEKSFNENLPKFKKTAFTSSDIKKQDASITGLGENRDFVRWVFQNDKGDVSDPLDFKDKFVVAYINNVQEKGMMNVAKAKQLTETMIRNEKKAKKIIAEKFKGNSLESYSQSSGAPITRADSLAFVSSGIPNIGMETKVIGVAFNRSQLNKVSEPIAGATGVFGVRVELIGAKSSGQSFEDIRKNLEGQQRNSGYAAISGLRKAATIKDYRFDFF